MIVKETNKLAQTYFYDLYHYRSQIVGYNRGKMGTISLRINS